MVGWEPKMMGIKTASPIANVRYYKNRTPTGRASHAKVKRGMQYYSYGNWREKEPQERGQWHSPDGVVSTEKAHQWASEQARLNEYTYTLMLSLRDGNMQEEDFTQAMEHAGFFDNWMLIQHRDSEHDHAHVIAFREKKLPKQEFAKWKELIMEQLQKAERHQLAQEQQLIQQRRQEQQLEQASRLERSRGQGYGW
jgi:hypothetical protein